MSNMDALLEAAAEDIRLIDCLGPEDLCLDPTSADGLKPVNHLYHPHWALFGTFCAKLTTTVLICSTTVAFHAMWCLCSFASFAATLSICK